MRKSRSSDRRRRGFLPRAAILLLVFPLSALLSACSHLTSEVGRHLPPKPAALVIGKSHLSDVLGVVGPPSRISAAAGGFAMLYEYNAVEEKQLGFNIDIPVLYLIKFVGAKSWLEHQAWLVTFDTNGIVRGWGEEQWRTVLGRGAGAQILVTVSSLVDSSQVRRPAPQHDWGKSSLAPLPKALNAGESLDNGSLGLEQTLAPAAVGQRTLEMTPVSAKFPKKK
jgi:hypothetical protein